MNLELLTEWASELERDASLEEAGRFEERLEVLERLEAALVPFALEVEELTCAEQMLYRRLKRIESRLEATNRGIYRNVRRDIRNGLGRTALLPWFASPVTLAALNREGYDFLDELIAGVCDFEEPGLPAVQPTADMVFYQPTPVRHILDLLNRVPLNEEDVLVDIGSGLGHVPIMASICTPAHTIGVEIEPAYVACARRVVASLNLPRVTFVAEDARSADLRDGTVFYLYTPFLGAMLRATLDVLRRQADTRAITVCTFGPCAEVLAGEEWLHRDGEVKLNRISVFRSHISSTAKI